jgi:hypothetical protein
MSRGAPNARLPHHDVHTGGGVIPHVLVALLDVDDTPVSEVLDHLPVECLC